MCGMVTDKRTGYTKKKTMMSTITCEDLSGAFEVLLFGKNFDSYNRLVEKNKPYLFVGRRQMREGGELSMFADSVFELSDDPTLLSRIRNDRGYQTALRERDGAQTVKPVQVPVVNSKSVQAGNVQSVPAAPVQVQQEAAPAKAPEIVAGGGVLRIRYSGRPDSKGFNRLLNFLAYFHGNMPVEVLFKADNSVLRLDNMCSIAPDEAVLTKLAELVGEDNIEMI